MINLRNKSTELRNSQVLPSNNTLKDQIQKTENLTILLIAHRLSTVQNADQIIVIDKGQVVESGNHTELMSKQSFYFNLVSRQISTQEKQSEMLKNHGQNDYDNI